MLLAFLVVKVPRIQFELLDGGRDGVEASQREPLEVVFRELQVPSEVASCHSFFSLGQLGGVCDAPNDMPSSIRMINAPN